MVVWALCTDRLRPFMGMVHLHRTQHHSSCVPDTGLHMHSQSTGALLRCAQEGISKMLEKVSIYALIMIEVKQTNHKKSSANVTNPTFFVESDNYCFYLQYFSVLKLLLLEYNLKYSNVLHEGAVEV